VHSGRPPVPGADAHQEGFRIEFLKENLTFTGEDSPLANLMLSVMGAFAEFERALIGERQREGTRSISGAREGTLARSGQGASGASRRRRTEDGSGP
jgi:DNA invertase Pin-like site-specific DNA recombinase